MNYNSITSRGMGIKALRDISREQIFISPARERARAISLFPQIPTFVRAFCPSGGALNREPEDVCVSPSALMPISHVGNWTRHKNFSVKR